MSPRLRDRSDTSGRPFSRSQPKKSMEARLGLSRSRVGAHHRVAVNYPGRAEIEPAKRDWPQFRSIASISVSQEDSEG